MIVVRAASSDRIRAGHNHRDIGIRRAAGRSDAHSHVGLKNGAAGRRVSSHCATIFAASALCLAVPPAMARISPASNSCLISLSRSSAR